MVLGHEANKTSPAMETASGEIARWSGYAGQKQ